MPCFTHVNQWKCDNTILTLEWPEQSPDLNTIEILWKILKYHIERQMNEIQYANDLKVIVAKIWSSLDLHYIKS